MTESEINQLVLDNMGFVVSIAQQYRNLGNDLDLDDLISEGTFAMLKAAHKWDPDKGVRFVNYAVHDIRKAMERALPESVITTEALPEKLKAGKPLTNDAAEDNDLYSTLAPVLEYLNEREQQVIIAYYGIGSGERYTMEEIGEQIGCTRERVRQIRKTAERKMRRILNHNVFI